MNRLDQLLLRWHEGDLRPEELDDLLVLLETPEGKRRLVEDFQDTQAIREALGMKGHSARAETSGSPPEVKAVPRRRAWALAAAAVLLASLGSVAFFAWDRSPRVVARVDEVRGKVLLLPDRSAIASGQEIRLGQGLETAGPGSAASVVYPDGTRLNSGADTILSRMEDGEAGKRLFVLQGIVRATVAPQPEKRSMVFSTPQGEVEVLGTTLRLLVESDSKKGTRLDVEEGKVRLKNLAGKTVDVSSGHYAVAAAGVDLILKPLSASISAGAALIAKMPPDSWVSVPGTHLRTVTPDPAKYPSIRGATGAEGVVDAGGAALDTRRNRLVLWGGGSSSYYGNELYAFQLENLTWERLTDPCPTPALGKQVNPDGSPASRSPYNGLAYIAHVDRFFASGGTIAGNQGGTGADITWTFDFTTNRWTDRKPSGTRPPTHVSNLCSYDPTTEKVWWGETVAGANGLYSYDYNANRWEKHEAQGDFYGKTGAIDTKRGRLVTVGEGKVIAYDLRAGDFKGRTWTTTGGDTFITQRYLGLDYDPIADRIVGWSGGAVYLLDPDTKIWTAHDAPGAPAPTRWGIFGRWRYVPSLRVFVVVTSVDEDVHFYRPP